jgi:hypothetical protein
MSDRYVSFRLFLVASPLMVAAMSCTSAAREVTSGVARPLTPMSRHIDAAQIRRAGAATAWDVLRGFAPFQTRDLRSLPTRRPEPASGSGILGLPAPRIILDGMPLVDPGVLRAMPAEDVISIDLVGALDAVMLFGQSFGGGAIVIRTQRGASVPGGQ